MENIIFYILSGISIGSALLVVLSKNPVYSVLSLIMTFASISGHLLLLSAEFLAIVNLIVYAGAIMVLFLFVIMMLNLNEATEKSSNIITKIAATATAGLLLISLVYLFKSSQTGQLNVAQLSEDFGSANQLGKILFNEFLLPFEISSVLFLSAMIGAVMLGKKDLKQH